ncbi:ASCH domain-containing protein [Lysinibacillus sp. BW-2-10]|uniref:ASCH domain-containing protein n=1 Tax=Lysinibacillus sp. BW-2-10 TaxID=2590030 RepID=UPI00117F457F|nr:ASCH domain-containing protein [Lysinibacillus sp. BW-2-10]TSI06240.1 ASCH domain-containing protein [Lysinibacillus sp. BW-2-10]
MNKIEKYWQDFCKAENIVDVKYRDAFQFGEKIDWLASLVVDGKKKATCSSYELYDIKEEPLPKTGEYSIVLNSENIPVAIIETESVEIYPLNEVPEDFALAEGEGDYTEWWNVHVNFFTNLLKRYNKEFTEDMPVVCDRFKKVYPK